MALVIPVQQIWAEVPSTKTEDGTTAQESSPEADGASTRKEPPAEAKDTSPSPLEQIEVRARRFKEYLQIVPASVNVMTTDYLESQGLKNVRDIVDFAPGGATTAFNKMQDNYTLRGISSQTEGPSGDSSIPIVIDDVTISREFMKSQNLFDLELVEILRGPQGTSFGRNASSGLILLRTARPQWRSTSGVTAELGSHETSHVDAFVTGPLGESAAGRLAMYFDRVGGYTEDTRTGDRLGGTENLALRGSVLFKASDDVKVFVKTEYSRDDDENPSPRKGKDCTIPYQGDFPEPSIAGAPQPPWTRFPNWFDSCDPWETAISEPTYLGDFFLDREIFNLTAETTWSINGDLTMTSISAYLAGKSDYLIDTHGGPNHSMFQSTQNDAWQVSQELRLDNHSTVNRVRWLTGVYFLLDDHERDDQNIFFVDDAVFDPQDPSGFRPEGRDVKRQTNETTASGLFGEVSFDLSEKVNFTFAARLSQDEKDYGVAHYGWGWGGPIAGLTNGVDADGDGEIDERCVFEPGGPPDFGSRFCGSPADPVGFEVPVATSASWSNLSLKGSMSYRIDADRMVYALVSEGYKTGGFQNEPFNPFDAVVPYGEETALNYELGMRATFAEKFRINASVFLTQYDDLQLFLFLNSDSGDYNQVTTNAAGADVLGLELDYYWRITDRLHLAGTYARIDAELVDARIDTDGDFVEEDFSGTRPSRSPTWTANAVLEYSQPLKNGSLLKLRGDWRGLSNFYDGIGEDPNREHEAYGVFGARFTWRGAAAKWSLSVWGRNLFDEAYTTNVGPYNPNLNQLNFAYGPPRHFGVTLKRFLF